ncbi:uncharacterized protein DSM5745_10962 [Aspergillus mulundensis]|uniref:Uncharacterized protein n=1 Tax=Aspergillus mulundensis TaxID=1810919 RepID=A0A3D8QGF9_9EURO|nr:hypothetical protein DSM5745_10962 [Aspergillus mulundensis]RDW60504.1 hypothetical protein DSM5745_10962 [Aspergillus mulundensis]
MPTRVPRVSRLLLQSRRLYGLPRPLTHVRHNHTGPPFYGPKLRNPKRNISPFITARQSHTSPSPGWPTWNFDVTQIKTTGSKLLEPHWASQDLSVVDNLIDHQTIRQFLMFLGDGILPNGKKTSLRIMDEEEGDLFLLPSAEWAPAPFNSCTVTIIHKLKDRIGKFGDTSRLCRVGQNIHSLKRQLEDGIVPMPDSRWIEKDLNNPKHFNTAREHLTAVLVVFEYLNTPEVRDNMRGTFNLIAGDLQELQDALNARRKLQDPNGNILELNLVGLWEAFIRAKYEIMTATAHSWVLSRVAELRDHTINEFCNVPQVVEKMDSEETKVYQDRIQNLTEITAMADLMIWMSMDGYTGYQPPAEVTPGLHYPGLDAQKKGYQGRYEELIQALHNSSSAYQSEPGRLQTLAALRVRFSILVAAQDMLRKEIRGRLPPQPPLVHWIEYVLKSHEYDLKNPQLPEVARREFGFAIYRAAYKASDEEWQTVKRNMEAHILHWGNNIQGADEVKPLLRLHWFDCKELGLDFSDTAAAKRHFQQWRESDSYREKINTDVFLMIDDWSAASYRYETHPAIESAEKVFPGNSAFRGHLLAVDADFDSDSVPESEVDHSESHDEDRPVRYQYAPGYVGHMRILGNLVWSELFAMLTTHSARLTELWPLAMDNPQRIYTGQTVPCQLHEWREQSLIASPLKDGFGKWLKDKDPRMAEHIKRLRAMHVI